MQRFSNNPSFQTALIPLWRPAEVLEAINVSDEF